MSKDMKLNVNVDIDFTNDDDKVEAVILFKGANKVPVLYINGKEQKAIVSLEYKYITRDAYFDGINEIEAVYLDDDKVSIRTTKVSNLVNG